MLPSSRVGSLQQVGSLGGLTDRSATKLQLPQLPAQPLSTGATQMLSSPAFLCFHSSGAQAKPNPWTTPELRRARVAVLRWALALAYSGRASASSLRAIMSRGGVDAAIESAAPALREDAIARWREAGVLEALRG